MDISNWNLLIKIGLRIAMILVFVWISTRLLKKILRRRVPTTHSPTVFLSSAAAAER